MKERQDYKHPSFGMLSISRIHGQSGYLFGTEIQADNFIELTLSNAILERDLTQDWFHQDKTLFRVKMSPNQFAELMTNLNTSPGVPVTIEEVCGERIEQCTDMESKKTYTHNQFRQRMAELMVDINKRWKQAEKIIDKKTLTKDDQRELKLFYDKLTTEVKSNIPFFAKCFQEVMDKVVLDAKTEIDSALLRVVVDAGIKALGIDGNNEGTKYISQD
jgi:Glu-tRNA(Gln) amidotransferase subunit E-like FAD-binding protein